MLFSRSTQKCLTISTLAALAFGIALPISVRAEENAGTHMETIFRRQYDYIIYCDLQKFPTYMAYKGSSMSPVFRFLITYQQTNHLKRNAPIPPVLKFEEIWYANTKCVGLHRYNDINPGGLQQGAIYFRALGDATLTEADKEQVNCCIRQIMNIYVKRSILAGVYIPAATFDQFGADIAPYNFFTLEDASGGKGENLSVHLQSYPRGRDKYYYFDDTGRR